MTSFYVMGPADLQDPVSSPREADRLVFIPEKFSWGAFVLSILWLIWHRMWLVLLGFLTVSIAVQGAANFAGGPAPFFAGWAVAFLLALEANGLRRWTLQQADWRTLGLVTAADETEAELRYFAKLQAQADGRVEKDHPPAPIERRSSIIPRVGTERVAGLTLSPEAGR
ncbi:DUF2628 domain-containing protein [Roseibium limicola]|uniref:DUF2628 domain-containing protein n=1 Tax=Roseibium limicola TaxID=2816037 RepID=A0A939ER77_9HYPH|nr:DUF2628 domain-containing protein [Roseibium limicola]MBO0347189.1 DUF2628 domain-containing protein [Roseibium limicola]